MRSTMTALTGALALLTFTRAATAQTTEATPPPASAPPPVAPAEPAPAPAPETAPAAVAPAAPTDEDKADKTRFRFAVHLVGGPWLLPDRSGGAGGVGFQLGAQINDTIGVYYNGTAAVGVAYGTAGAFVYNSVVPELTLANIVQIGAGPSLDSFAFGSVSLPTAGGAKVVAIAGTFFGVQARAGIAIGPDRPGKKGHFMLGVELHPTFIPDVIPTSILFTIGGGSF